MQADGNEPLKDLSLNGSSFTSQEERLRYRKLGRSGLEVSQLALGTMQWGWTASEESAYAVMDAFVEAGGTLLDTADVYSRWAPGNPGGVSEEIIGRWMRSRNSRHRIVLATKVRGRMWDGPNGEGLGRAHIMRAADDSLRRLQTDYIDLYQVHSFDAESLIEETLAALDHLIRAGKVLYVGCSNYPAWRLMQSLWASDASGLASYVSLQPHYNLVHRAEFERELAEVVEHYGLGVLPYSPLAGGFLTGKYRRGSDVPDSQRAATVKARYFSDRNFDLIDGLTEIARQHGRDVPAIALAWLLANPRVTAPIVGANSVEQLWPSLDALEISLSAADMARLNELSTWQ
jgi:aryl-alcohol dehydrogenase-like predicted oxidoreductase